MTAPAVDALPPAMLRRLAAFLYEGVLLFGVVFFAGYLFSVSTSQHHALQGRHTLGAFLFVVIGIYFVWFRSRSGQTLALKTWHLRVVTLDGQPVGQWRALLRYLLAWLWFLPALVSAWAMEIHSGGALSAIVLGGMVAYAMLAKLHPQQLLLHEALSGTRVVNQYPNSQ